MAKTKLSLIRQVEKHPVLGRTALRVLLDMGHGKAAQITRGDDAGERAELERLVPDDERERAKIKRIYEMVYGLGRHEHDFVFDLMAMSSGYVSADELRRKYMDDGAETGERTGEYRYFEVCIGKGPEEDPAKDAWLCIKASPGAEPDAASLAEFLASDLAKRPGDVIVGFYLIEEPTARGCYDFSREAEWPVFEGTAS